LIRITDRRHECVKILFLLLRNFPFCRFQDTYDSTERQMQMQMNDLAANYPSWNWTKFVDPNPKKIFRILSGYSIIKSYCIIVSWFAFSNICYVSQCIQYIQYLTAIKSTLRIKLFVSSIDVCNLYSRQ
jgi:hypothetical protein